jgi:hypothetical protein
VAGEAADAVNAPAVRGPRQPAVLDVPTITPTTLDNFRARSIRPSDA